RYASPRTACSDVGQADSSSTLYSGPIHLLVTDVVMPPMSGVELARRLIEKRLDVRVLYTSGYTEHPVVHKRELGPRFAFLPKPYVKETLLDESTSLFRRLEAHEPIETDEPTDARQIPAGEALGRFPEATHQSRNAIVTIIQSAPLGDDASYRRFEVDEALLQASGNRARFYGGIGIKFKDAPGIGEVSDIF